MRTVSCDATPRTVSGIPAAEDEWIAALQADDGAPLAAVMHEQLVHLLLRQAVARDAQSAGRLQDELGRNEPVVHQHLAALDELKGADGDKPGVPGAGADDRNAHPSASDTSAWKNSRLSS